MADLTAGVPATAGQVPAVTQDPTKPHFGEKVKATIAHAKERLQPGEHPSANPSPASTPSPSVHAKEQDLSSTPSATEHGREQHLSSTPSPTHHVREQHLSSTPSPTEHVTEQHISSTSSPGLGSSLKETHPPNPDGGRVGDRVSPRPKASDIPRREGEPAKPKLPHKDWGERIIEKLPFSHVNPYSVGHPVDSQNPNPYVSGSDQTDPTAPSGTATSSHSPRFVAKIKNLVTGQKPTQGTATDNATSGTAGIPEAGARGVTSEKYAQDPLEHPTGDLYDRAKSRIGTKDEHGTEKWPAPARPGATYTDEQGRPLEGPTQPMSEDTKKEGLMTKIMDKFHLNEKSSSPSSTRAAETAPGKNHTVA